MQEKTTSEAIHYRRSVRIYNEHKDIDSQKVKECLELAALAPNSSNMQLWEFYHITDKRILNKIAPFCFNQNAAKTAKQLIVFVTRKDLWRKRARANLKMIDALYGTNNSDKMSKREKELNNKKLLIDEVKTSESYKNIIEHFSDAELIDVKLNKDEGQND